MKVINSSHLNPFGGINFVFESFDKLGIDKILQKNLPVLPNQCTYNWKDILYSFWSIYFCGGECIEDIGLNLNNHFRKNKFINIPSPDRLIDRFKSLSQVSVYLKSPRGKSTHQFSINLLLNSLLLKVSKKAGLFKSDNLTLDYDNTIIPTDKADSKNTYIKTSGYQPGIGFINGNVAYVENRNGNSDAQTLQNKTLERMFHLLDEQEIKIQRFRADGASYQLLVLELLNKKVDYFYIRAGRSEAMGRAISAVKEWKELEISGAKKYRAEIKYTPFKGTTAQRHKIKEKDLSTYRLIITKEERRDKQIDLFTGEACFYRCIITNDFEKDMDEIVTFYNQRGSVERQFDILKNDFGWGNLAFSKLEYNTVFLIFTAICKNLYDYIITEYSKKFKHLDPKFRIKKFIFRFICLPAKWLKQSRQMKLKIFGKISYKT